MQSYSNNSVGLAQGYTDRPMEHDSQRKTQFVTDINAICKGMNGFSIIGIGTFGYFTEQNET